MTYATVTAAPDWNTQRARLSPYFYNEPGDVRTVFRAIGRHRALML